MNDFTLESNCLFCVMNYVRKLIDIENAGVDIAEFYPKDLLFILGEKITEKNMADMIQAKEYFYTEKYIHEVIT